MANNRLWVVCKDDSKCTLITKYYPDSEGWGDLSDHKEGVAEFMLKHDGCPSNHGCGENILFITETPDDPRVELYDFTRKEENDGEIRIIIKK